MLKRIAHSVTKLDRRLALGLAAAALGLAGIAGFLYSGTTPDAHSEMSSQSRTGSQRYSLTPAEWASLAIQPVTERAFRAEHVTEGKNRDR